MDENTMTTVWEPYDPVRHYGKGGNYLFLLKAFDSAPFYVGQAKIFANRFAAHDRLFANGGRTFMREDFIEGSEDRSHKGFAARWYHYKQQSLEEQQRLVWVPKSEPSDSMSGLKGVAFRKDNVKILVSMHDGERKAVERRIQIDLVNYYCHLFGKSIDWTIPKWKPRENSHLMGLRPGSLTQLSLRYQVRDWSAKSGPEFFSKLLN